MENVLDKKLQKYFVQLNDLEKKSVLTIIKTFIANKVQSNSVYTLEQYNNELDNAESEIDTGNFVTQEEMEKMASKW